MKHLIRLVLVVGLLFLSGCKNEILYGDLSEADANAMLGLLLARGVDADKMTGKEGKFSIYVPRNQFAEAVSTLQWFGLPKQEYKSLGDLFQKSGMVSSPTEERVRYVYGLSQTIAETLSRIDGVVTSRVNLVLPDNDPFNGAIKPSSASVFLRFRPGLVPSTLIPEIKNLVVNSVEGLSYDHVAVTISQAETLDYYYPAKMGKSHDKFLGITVEAGNARRLWFVFGGMLLLGIVTGVGFQVLLRRGILRFHKTAPQGEEEKEQKP